MFKQDGLNLEVKFHQFDAATALTGETEISGYASVFGTADTGGDVVQKGAYARCLKALKLKGTKPKMLWQHDPAKPIGVWDEIREDSKGLFVKGRVLDDIQGGREALALIKAGAIDGLSIGYRTVRAEHTKSGGRLLHELELWEVSLVTFPMLPEARVGSKADDQDQLAHELVDVITEARNALLA